MSTLTSHDAMDMAETRQIVRAGLIGGLVGGVTIWIYEAIVWVGAQHLMPLAGIPRNATGLVFGKAVQDSLGPLAYVVGTAIHFFFVRLGRGVRLRMAVLAPPRLRSNAGGHVLCRHSLDRDACRDRDRLERSSELP
jgi:hypothetical protein